MFGPNAGIFVYGTPSERWVPTRSLWNQYTYHITNILDDGTIPRREANNWEIYNNYRQNVLIDGCVYALPDLTASFVRKETVGSNVLLTARVGNGGGNAVGPEVPVSFYNGDPGSGGVLLGTARTGSIAARSFEDVSLMVPVGTEALPLWVVADDEGGLTGIHTESNEANNAVDGQVYLTSTEGAQWELARRIGVIFPVQTVVKVGPDRPFRVTSAP